MKSRIRRLGILGVLAAIEGCHAVEEVFGFADHQAVDRVPLAADRGPTLLDRYRGPGVVRFRHA